MWRFDNGVGVAFPRFTYPYLGIELTGTNWLKCTSSLRRCFSGTVEDPSPLRSY